MPHKKRCNKKCRTNRARAAVAMRFAVRFKKEHPGTEFRTALKNGWNYAKGKSGGGKEHKAEIRAARKELHGRRRRARKRHRSTRRRIQHQQIAKGFEALPFGG